MTTGLQSVTNFLVPATGSTNAYQIRDTFSSTPKFINFNNVELDGQAFRPSGVIVDNTQGDDDLVILINEISYRIVVPAGQTLQMPYPAPLNHTANITGDGDATVLFVDYPVIPYGGSVASGGGGEIPQPLEVFGNVNITTSPLEVEGGVEITNRTPINTSLGSNKENYAYYDYMDGTNSNIGRDMVYIRIENVGDADATIGGDILPPGAVAVFHATPGKTIRNNLSVNALGTKLTISEVSLE